MKKMNKKYKHVAVLLLTALCCIKPITECCKDLRCYVDYIDTLTCNYGRDKGKNAGISYTLHAEWTLEESQETCSLIPSDREQEYICTVDMEDFNVEDNCTIFITANINEHYHSSLTCGPFTIGGRFKPVAPFNLTVSFSGNYNISWKTSYESNVLRNGELTYELSYKKTGESWLDQKSIEILEDEKNVVLLKTSFEANNEYVARIRARPNTKQIYSGHWSEWSTPVMWRTSGDEPAWQHWIYIPSMLLIICIMLMKWFRKPACLWKNVWLLVPDPAHFFKPLYTIHHGDFKSWLGPPHFPTMSPMVGVQPQREVLDIYSHNIHKNTEEHSSFLPKSCSRNKSQGFRKCNDIREKISKIIYVDDDESCFEGLTITDTMDGLKASINEDNSSKDDGFSEIDLDSGNSNMLNHLVDHGPTPEGTTKTTLGLRFLLQHQQRPNMNILALLSIPPEEWELPESSSQEDDENVFYNDENYNSFSPGSGNSAEFGYPRIGLDLDTIDSGFAHSECGSPVDSDFGNSDIAPKTLSSDLYGGEEEISERNYVKQWVPFNSTGTNSQTKN